MALRQDNEQIEFRRDGSFLDASMEKDFRALNWLRDCRQFCALALPVAATLAIPIPLNGINFGWDSPIFLADMPMRIIAVLMCMAAHLKYKDPPEKPQSLTFPFATALATSVAVLISFAIGAFDIAITTPCVITATLCFWAFLPLKTRYLIFAGGSLCIGYVYLLLTMFPDDYMMVVIPAILLTMINTVGFFHVRNHNMSERKEMLSARQLRTTTETLRQEIATRIEAEKHAGASEEIFHGIFVSCPVPLCMIDFGTLEFLRANQQMTELLGYSNENWEHRPIREIFVDDHAFDEAIQILQRNNSLRYDEVRMRTKDGQTKWVLLSARSFSMPDRDTVLVSFVDITDQKQKEIDLAIATQEAQKANVAKSQFLANMSHELRTPLNAIIGFSDIMESEVFGAIGNERYLGYMTDIKSSGIHLLSIINEILDLSKIESSSSELRHEEVDLNEIVEIAVRLIRHHAHEKAIQIDVDLDGDDPVLMADERAIKQIVLNLLSNAVKFTPAQGSIDIKSHQHENRIIIEIVDTGIGIPEDQLDTITEPFVQLESTLTNIKAGTGLGLSIATRLAELHGGSIEFESKVDTGTTARLILPHIANEEFAS